MTVTSSIKVKVAVRIAHMRITSVSRWICTTDKLPVNV